MAFIAAPEALAALMQLYTYVAFELHVAVAPRSWNGAYSLNHVANGQTPVCAWPVMIACPFLFCQKPIVSPPQALHSTLIVWLLVSTDRLPHASLACQVTVRV